MRKRRHIYYALIGTLYCGCGIAIERLFDSHPVTAFMGFCFGILTACVTYAEVTRSQPNKND